MERLRFKSSRQTICEALHRSGNQSETGGWQYTTVQPGSDGGRDRTKIMSFNTEGNSTWLSCDKCQRTIGRDWGIHSRGPLSFHAIGKDWYCSDKEDLCDECMEKVRVVHVEPCCPQLTPDPDRIISHEKTHEAIRRLHDFCDEIPAPRCWEAKGALLAVCMRLAALEDALKDL